MTLSATGPGHARLRSGGRTGIPAHRSGPAVRARRDDVANALAVGGISASSKGALEEGDSVEGVGGERSVVCGMLHQDGRLVVIAVNEDPVARVDPAGTGRSALQGDREAIPMRDHEGRRYLNMA